MSEITEKDLKPCPFCGGKALAAHHTSRQKDDEYYLIMCSKCFARAVGEIFDEAVEVWNRRNNP